MKTNFYDKDNDPTRASATVYSELWKYLRNFYGLPRETKGSYGSVFSGGDGGIAVLIDNSPKSIIHELVLINVPAKISQGLQKLIQENQ